MAGALKRMVAGMQVFVTEATGPGQMLQPRWRGPYSPDALESRRGDSRSGAPVPRGYRQHRYSFERVRGVANLLFGGSGFFVDKFHGRIGEGVLWLHGYGNVFEKVLGPGESIDVEPGGWLYKDTQVTMGTNATRLSTGILAGTSLVLNRFTGPGRIGLQSMYVHLPSE